MTKTLVGSLGPPPRRERKIYCPLSHMTFSEDSDHQCDLPIEEHFYAEEKNGWIYFSIPDDGRQWYG